MGPGQWVGYCVGTALGMEPLLESPRKPQTLNPKPYTLNT